MGFADEEDFSSLTDTAYGVLRQADFLRVQLAVRGSAATGVSYRTGAPFDGDRVSDLDLAIAGEDIFAAAQRIGVELRSGGTRTVVLTPLQLEDLGLGGLDKTLGEMAGRKVSFMIYRSMDDAIARGPTIVIPNP